MNGSVRYMLLTASLAACSSIGPGPLANEVDVVPSTVSLAPGGAQQLSVTVLDEGGHPILSPTVTYASGDAAVATVSTSGLVQGVAPGATYITVRSTPASSTIPVTVTALNPAAGSLVLSPDDPFLQGSETVQLTAVVYDTLGIPIPGSPVQYISRDQSVVTVSTTGLVSRAGSGSTWVRASSGAARDSVMVTAVVARIPMTGTPFGAAVSASGVAYVTRMNNQDVGRIDLPTPTVVAGVTVGSLPTSVAFNQAGTIAYVGNQSGSSVMAINTSTNAVFDTVAIPGSPLAVAVAPGDTTLLVGSDGGQLYVVRLPAFTIVDSVPVGQATNAIVIRGTTAYANAVLSGTITRINLGNHQTTTFTIGGTVEGLALSANGSELYVANEVGEVEVLDASTGAEIATVPLSGGGGFGLALNPANGRLYVSTSYYGSRVHVIDPVTRSVVRVILTGGTPRRIAFTATGTGVVANEGGWVDIIQ